MEYCVLSLLLLPCLATAWTVKNPQVSMEINTSKPVWVLNDRYLSLGLDVNLIRNRWEKFNFSSVQLQTMAQALAPAYLRVSGTDGDRMIFKPRNCNMTEMDPYFLFPGTNFYMTADDWDKLNNWCSTVGWRVMFGFNAQLRNGSSWDPTNAIQLLDYSVKQGYAPNLDFQLGNEPDLFVVHENMTYVSGQQLAKDYNFFKTMLKSKYGKTFEKSLLVGPEVAFCPMPITRDFLRNIGDAIDYVTFHHYYGLYDLTTVENFTNPTILDKYIPVVDDIIARVKRSPQPNRKIWNGETSSVAGIKDVPVSQSYAAGFMLMDKLGVSAKMGLDLVVRQTYFGFCFALVDENFLPRPHYWMSVLYKNLVGKQYLDLSSSMPSEDSRLVRLFSHCTNDSRTNYKAGAVTIYGLNVASNPVHMRLNGSLAESEIHEYLFIPATETAVTDKLDAKYTILNSGKPLKMVNEKTLPEMKPRILPKGSVITFPAKRYAFWVIPDARAKACMKEGGKGKGGAGVMAAPKGYLLLVVTIAIAYFSRFY